MSDAKRSLGVSDDEHDREILDLIEAAANVFRRWAKRELTLTQYRLSLAEFECPLRLPYPPLVSVESVKYRDSAGVLTPITDYQIDKSIEVAATLYPAPDKVWPIPQTGRVNAVEVEYTAGYATVPPEAKRFILLLARHWYDNPSAVIGTISKEVEFSLRSLAASLGTGFYADV